MMDKEQILAGILIVLIVISAFQTYQLKSLGSKITGNSVANEGGPGGETYEQMMERMHGGGSSSQSAATQSTESSAGAGMVGGC